MTGDGGHSADLLRKPLPLSGHLTGGYVASPSATPKFDPLQLRKLHISPKRYPKFGSSLNQL